MRLLYYLLSLFLCLSCGKKGATQEGNKRPLSLAFHADISSLDPGLTKQYPASHVIRMLFDGLFRRNASGVLEPSVAKAHDISEDGLTYTFYLRSSYWTDDLPVTAHDFEYAWKKCIDPHNAAADAAHFYPIKNAEACIRGRLPKEELGAKAIDAHTFEVKLEHPIPYYRDLYETGSIDWLGRPINQISPDLMQAVKDSPTFSTLEVSNIRWFMFNVEKFPFNNEKIRKAFALAIDRKSIVDHLLNGHGTPAQGVIAPCLQWNHPPYFKDGDMGGAKRCFEEGLEELQLTQRSFPKVSVGYSAGQQINHLIAQAVQQFWERAFGIPITLLRRDWTVHCDAMDRGDYQIGFMGWSTLACDPIYILRDFKNKTDNSNESNWESADYQNLLDLSLYERDIQKRQNLLLQAETILMDEMPVIPLFFLDLEYVTHPDLCGFTLSSSQDVDFKFAYFKPSRGDA